MTIPLWTLLGFALWTLITLLIGVGAYRWARILSGRAALNEFPADTPHGEERYRRATRAHANCLENLPVYGAIVLATFAMELRTDWLDTFAIVFLAGRVLQTVTHVAFSPSNLVVGVRFGFFFVQILSMFAMSILVIRGA